MNMADSDINDSAVLAQICEQCQLSPEDIQDTYPCTPLQSGMMVDSSLYIYVVVHKIESHVDLDRLCGSLEQVVAMNDALRTRIVDCDGAGLLQVVVKKGQPVLRSAETDLKRFLEWNASVRTDLGTPLIRFTLVGAGGDDSTRLVTTIHHVMFDFHVMEFLIADAWSVYQGIPSAYHAPFKSFVEHCSSVDSKEAAAFWKSHFKSGASVFPPIPADHRVLAKEVMTREISFSNDDKAKTLLSTALMPAYLEAAWAMTASDYTRSDNVAFGYILSGRGPGLPGGAETTFGPTITTVPVQVDLRRNMTVQQLVRGRATSRRELSTSPFLQYGLRNIRNITSDTHRASSFQSVLNIRYRSHTIGLGTSGLSLDEAYTEEPPKPYGLLLICAPGEKQISIKTLFDPVVLAREQVHRILRQLEHRLSQLVTSPPSTPLKRLPCLNFGDTLELMDWNARHFPSGPVDACLHSRIASRGAQHPDDLAVQSWDGEATYAELATMVNNLAHEIIAACPGSITPEEPIYIMLGRSLSLTVALLAVMRVGGSCVPIDPSLPEARKEAIVRQCQARLILTSPDSPRQEYQNSYITHAVILSRSSDVNKAAGLPADTSTPSRAAYILFTSGSTGQPKGVVLEHRSLASTFTAWAEVLGWTRGSRVLQYSAPAWDACGLEVIGSLLAGSCICIPSDWDRESGLGEFIRSAQVGFAVLTPTALRNLAPEDVLPILKTLVSAGELIPRKVFETWSDKARLFNAWGPCEASVVASMGHLAPDSRYPDTVGTPTGCAVWIVDPEDVSRLLPIGAMGEMLIDGPGVGREYYLAPDLSRASFIKPPSFVPKRQSGLESRHLYRTGDLARYHPDGTIAFSGRRDNQIKIRGQRFELGAVESVLASHQGVSEIVVTTHQTSTGSVNKDLVAVLAFSKDSGHHDDATAMDGIPLDIDSRHQLKAIQKFAEDHLATYMVPTTWLVVRGLPQTPSRKVDRVKIKAWLDAVDMSAARDDTAQPNPQTASSQGQAEHVLTPPSTPAEVALQQAWSSVLDIDPAKIGQESSLMRLGGDSITAMQVATRCRKQGFQVAVADLLRKATLVETARDVQTAQETLATVTPTMSAADESQNRPLSAIQKFLGEDGGPASHSQFNQAFLLDLNSSIATVSTPTRIQKALGKLVAHHPMLRCRFSQVKDASGNATLTQWIAPQQQRNERELTWGFRTHYNIGSQYELGEIVSRSQASLNIVQGPVFAADVIIGSQKQTSLLLVAHHLVIDLMSWRILWDDLEALFQDDTCVLPPSLPFSLWLQSQRDMLRNTTAASSSPLRSYLPLWPKADRSFWKMDNVTPKSRDLLHIEYTLDQEQTTQIMGPSCNLPFNTSPVVLLLTVVVLSFRRVFPDRGIPALYCEGHGRDTNATDKSVDTSRTIGWFTTLFPLTLQEMASDIRVEPVVMAVKDEYQDASKSAAVQFASQVLGERTSSSFKRSDIELIFNFAGSLKQVTRQDALLRLRTNGPPVHLENVTGDSEPVGLLSLFASVGADDRLTLTLDYNRHMAHQDRVVRWMQQEIGNSFREVTSTLPGRPCRLTGSDLPLLKLGPGPRSLEYLHSHLEGLGVAQDNVESIYPCTATQEGILFAQLNGHDYHNRFVSKITSTEGEVDPDRVVNAWKAVCQAHSILRTIFTTGLSDQGAFQQIVLKSYPPSISVKKMPAYISTIFQVVASQKKRPLDQKKPPHRLTLYRESASVLYAVLEITHTIIDARTYQDLWKHVAAAYASTSGSDAATVATGRPFSDYVIWLQSQEVEARQHWRRYVEGVKPCVFPLDPTASLEYVARGPIVPFNDAHRLNRFCQERGVTRAMFMQAAWALVLRQHTRNSTVCFGSIRSDKEVLPYGGSTADILGPSISMLPCRFSLERFEALTALDVLEMTRSDAFSAMSHSGCYLAELHDDLGLKESPLFDTAMTIQRAWSADLGGDGGHLTVEAMDGEDPTEFSIVVGVQYSENRLLVQLGYQRARVSDSLIERIAETFARVAEYMIQSPDQPFALFFESPSAAPDSLGLLKQWNAEPPATGVNSTVVSVFRDIVRLQGSAPAVCSWDRDLTYSELDRLSDCLAYKLRVEHGVRSDMVVAFSCIKATSAVVIMLAIWKAGAAFLALDVSHPPERLSAILSEAEVKLVLANAPERVEKMTSCFSGGTVELIDLAVFEQAHAHNPDDVLRDKLSSYTIEPQHAGYLVYTSGSTGRPKGIVLTHGGIATTAEQIPRRLGLTSQSRILQLSNLVFDFGLLDVIFSWFCGACLCMPSDAEASSDVGGAVRRMDVTYVECTPTYATLFSPQDAPSLRTIVLGGEALRQENLDTWASHARVMNAYGPAEMGISSCGEVAVDLKGAIVQDIGRPAGCRYWIVDPEDHDELVPAGTMGELVIEGPILARGYINNPQAMAAAFIDAPAWTRHSELGSLGLGQYRFYKTGDLVTQRGENSFVYEGRKDTQVKIRGQRIEMGEIEYHLNQQTTEDEKWVVEAVHGGTSQELSLAAFCRISSKDAATLPASDDDNILPPTPKTAEAVAEALRKAVPSYMVPELWIPLRKFPTTGPMKTDRKALRAIASSFSQAELASYRLNGGQKTDSNLDKLVSAPGPVLTDLESLLLQNWAALLDVPAHSIRLDDDFFSLGGNSIRAMRLSAALKKSRHRLVVVDIFKSPTLAEMALKVCFMAGQRKGAAPKSAVGLQPRDVPRLGVLSRTRVWLDASNIEGVAPATDLQALMFFMQHVPGGASMVATISVEPLPGREQQSLDLARLQEACEQVLRHHGILRTVFIQNEQSLLQVSLRSPPVKQVHVMQTGERSEHRVSACVLSDMLDILPHFDLTSDESGSLCMGLKLTIHHAHYDAVSIGHLLDDLNNAYSGTAIMKRQPTFHEWSSHVSNADKVADSQAFWKELLKGSMSYPLSPSGTSKQQLLEADAQQKHIVSIQVPAANLASPSGTPATVLKAVWSCVLSQVLETPDTIFSFLGAIRFSGTLHDGCAEQVAGPCINLVPIRALMGDGTKTLATLVKELQEQSNESLSHQQVGFRSIVRNCTQWPTSRFNSIILFQNHESVAQVVRLGDTECAVVGVGKGADLADVWVTATPQADGILSVELRFSPVNVPPELCRWISGYFESLMKTLPCSWDRSIHDIYQDLLHAVGPNPFSPVQYEGLNPRSEGNDPGDIVDRVLQAKHFGYP